MTPLQDISELRFNALAAYCRTPQALAAAEEVRWLQSGSEAVLVVVIRDRPDQNEFAHVDGHILRDQHRCVTWRRRQLGTHLEEIQEVRAAAIWRTRPRRDLASTPRTAGNLTCI